MENYQQKLAEKEIRERDRRDRNSKSVSETLKSQMEIKERQKLIDAEEFKRQSDDIKQKIEISKRMEQERELQKYMQKQMYIETLAQQANHEEESKAYAYRLSDHEKLLNKSLLDESIIRGRLKRGADEIVKGRSISQPKIEDSYEHNPKRFFGAETKAPTPLLHEPIQYKGFNNSAKRVNPITGIDYSMEYPSNGSSKFEKIF